MGTRETHSRIWEQRETNNRRWTWGQERHTLEYGNIGRQTIGDGHGDKRDTL